MTPNPSRPNPAPGGPRSQGELFPDARPQLPARNWTPTSRQAAQAIREHAPTLRQRVLDHITAQGAHGATIDEIAQALGMLVATVCGRTNELWERQQIRDSGRTRATRSGRPAKIWEAR